MANVDATIGVQFDDSGAVAGADRVIAAANRMAAGVTAAAGRVRADSAGAGAALQTLGRDVLVTSAAFGPLGGAAASAGGAIASVGAVLSNFGAKTAEARAAQDQLRAAVEAGVLSSASLKAAQTNQTQAQNSLRAAQEASRTAGLAQIRAEQEAAAFVEIQVKSAVELKDATDAYAAAKRAARGAGFASQEADDLAKAEAQLAVARKGASEDAKIAAATKRDATNASVAAKGALTAEEAEVRKATEAQRLLTEAQKASAGGFDFTGPAILGIVGLTAAVAALAAELGLVAKAADLAGKFSDQRNQLQGLFGTQRGDQAVSAINDFSGRSRFSESDAFAAVREIEVANPAVKNLGAELNVLGGIALRSGRSLEAVAGPIERVLALAASGQPIGQQARQLRTLGALDPQTIRQLELSDLGGGSGADRERILRASLARATPAVEVDQNSFATLKKQFGELVDGPDGFLARLGAEVLPTLTPALRQLVDSLKKGVADAGVAFGQQAAATIGQFADYIRDGRVAAAFEYALGIALGQVVGILGNVLVAVVNPVYDLFETAFNGILHAFQDGLPAVADILVSGAQLAGLTLASLLEKATSGTLNEIDKVLAVTPGSIGQSAQARIAERQGQNGVVDTGLALAQKTLDDSLLRYADLFRQYQGEQGQTLKRFISDFSGALEPLIRGLNQGANAVGAGDLLPGGFGAAGRGETRTRSSVFGTNPDGSPDRTDEAYFAARGRPQDAHLGAFNDPTTGKPYNIADPNLAGVALPSSITAGFGDAPYAFVRNAASGKFVVVPVVDSGPGAGQLAKGFGIDSNPATLRAIDLDPKTNPYVTYGVARDRAGALALAQAGGVGGAYVGTPAAVPGSAPVPNPNQGPVDTRFFDPKLVGETAAQAVARYNQTLSSLDVAYKDNKRDADELARKQTEALLTLEKTPGAFDKLVQSADGGHDALQKLNDEVARLKATQAGNGLGLTESLVLGIKEAAAAAGDFSSQLSNIGKQGADTFASGLAGALVDVADGSKKAGAAFKQFTASFLEDIAKMILRSETLALLQQAFGGGSGSSAGGGFLGLFSGGSAASGAVVGSNFTASAGTTVSDIAGLAAAGFFHGGGIVGGAPTFTGLVPVASFEGAMRYHSGGVAGDVPAYLQDGEGVFTPEQMQNLARVPRGGFTGGGDTHNISVVINDRGQASSSSTSTNSGSDNHRANQQLGRTITGLVRQAIADEKRNGGLLDSRVTATAS